ncbi:hypothetical protein NPIL_425751 [Nephila pilipes]|uniref:Uncharacterized protein n=1 Tax=Nephila pilipes TaxID=299642 RepID=A0A8X6Q505_NEPPI|nr:hypothetical protein NPIL_425751 [Nephila pilipes]
MMNETLRVEESTSKNITVIKSDTCFEDAQTLLKNYNTGIPIEDYLQQFEEIVKVLIIIEKQKNRLLDEDSLSSSPKCHQIPIRLFSESRQNVVSEFGTQVNPAKLHLQIERTTKMPRETHIEYF